MHLFCADLFLPLFQQGTPRREMNPLPDHCSSWRMLFQNTTAGPQPPSDGQINVTALLGWLKTAAAPRGGGARGPFD